METALANNNLSDYIAAKEELDKAEAKEFNTSLLPSPEGAYYQYSGAVMTNDEGVVLYRIKATRDMPQQGVIKGDLGGWVDPRPLYDGSERISLAAWVAGDAQLYGQARITNRATLSGRAKAFGNARISGNVRVYGRAQVSGSSQIWGHATVSDNATVSGMAWISGRVAISGKANITGTIELADSEKRSR